MMLPTSQHNKISASITYRLLILTIVTTILASCSFPTATTINPTPSQTALPTTLPQETLITFNLSLNQPLPPGDSVSLTILDEVSGLAFNSSEYVMTANDAMHYSASIPFQLGAVVKYRYTRYGATSVIEHLSNSQPVRYRLFHVEGPGVITDILSRWTDTQSQGATGRVTGRITDANSGQPVPNLLITAGGAQTFSRADGSYLIEGLPEGVHNLVAYAVDGTYQIYQQGAVIAANSTTPASFTLSRSANVSVTFSVQVPENTPPEAPLRLAGNLFQLGNTFADLSGGVSTIASRMPTLTRLPDGQYEIVIDLPIGAYIEYKYTLGDGLWNAEHSPDGDLMTRRFIVPNSPILLTDTVSNWGTAQVAPITFDVTVPPNTPAHEGVSIQFNPGFGWLQPLPMWLSQSPQGQSIWHFILISPLEILGTIRYRICRADQCGIADDQNTSGTNPIGNVVNTSILPQTIQYTVSNWIWYQSLPQQASIPNVFINQKGSEFIAGIIFDSSYHPSWQSQIDTATQMVNNLGANWLFFSPTWSLTTVQPPVIEILPSQDIFWPDLIANITTAKDLGLSVGLYPILNFPIHPDQWWNDAPRDFSWWVVWFEQYSQFILHHADIASQNNVNALILGGEWLVPSLPGGTLMNGTPSGVPADATSRWEELIEKIQQHYGGTLIWILSYPGGVQNPPSFIREFDRVIIEWSAPLSSADNPSVTELYTEAARLLDTQLLPFSASTGKPLILGVEYPSANGASSGCIPLSIGSCISVSKLTTTHPSLPNTSEIELDLGEQADLYNAMLLAINERDWLTGLISLGFYPPVALHDPSISVYDKPAGGVLWYWFPRLLGSQP